MEIESTIYCVYRPLRQYIQIMCFIKRTMFVKFLSFRFYFIQLSLHLALTSGENPMSRNYFLHFRSLIQDILCVIAEINTALSEEMKISHCPE